MDEQAVGQLAQELYVGFMAYHASSHALDQPEIADAAVDALVALNRGPAAVPTATIPRAAGSEIVYDVVHAIRNLRQTRSYRDAYDRLWLAGAMLTLGDALDDEGCFDRGPDLEFVRHLRNGIAHGNKFNLVRFGEPKRPAHFTGGAEGTTFEITRALECHPVLFDFVGPGDVSDLLIFVAVRLIRIGNGDPPSPYFPLRP